MAKKKSPLTPGDGPKRRPPPKSSAPSKSGSLPGEPLKSPRAKPGSSRKASSSPADFPEPSSLDRAQALADRALHANDPEARLSLAREALRLSPDCSDAYLLLAEQAKGRKEAVELNGRAVDAALRVLGPEPFLRSVGQFWSTPGTRPYMRARANLAETLWTAGYRAEAADHLRDMLRLNPGDNQGLRHLLVGWLLDLDQIDELDRLLDRYDEASTTWTYTKALLAYRRGGDSPVARKALQAAKKANRHVPDYLLGQKPLPFGQPTSFTPGQPDDAIIYVAAQLGTWKSTGGALTWARARLAAPKKPRPRSRVGPVPSGGLREGLLSLPVEVDAWQADFRRFARRVRIAGERVRPWMILVASKSRDLVLAHALTQEIPTSEDLWGIVAEAMLHPAAGDPHRPTELMVRPEAAWGGLAARYDEIGVRCEPIEVLDQIDTLFADLTRHMEEAEPPGLLDMPGVTIAQVAVFHEAAARFYRKAPWRTVAFESVICIESELYQSGPWYAVIMGQSGLTLGMALYEDLALLRRMWAGKLSDAEGARRTVALTVTYDEEMSVSEADLEAIEKHGFLIAAPEAYPTPFRKDRGISMRPPLSWELDLLTASLETIPDFIARRDPSDTTREVVAVDHRAIPMELGLSWVEEPG